jgi:hypothetical protein
MFLAKQTFILASIVLVLSVVDARAQGGMSMGGTSGGMGSSSGFGMGSSGGMGGMSGGGSSGAFGSRAVGSNISAGNSTMNGNGRTNLAGIGNSIRVGQTGGFVGQGGAPGQANGFVGGAQNGRNGQAGGMNGANGMNGLTSLVSGMMGGQQGNQRNNRNGRAGQTTQQQANDPLAKIHPRVSVGFTPAQFNNTSQFASAVGTRLTKLPNVEVVSPVKVAMTGSTAVLSGTVATVRDREVIGKVALLEPGISDVKNEISVRGETNSDATQ